MFEINYGKIEILADCGNKLQYIARAPSEVAEAADFFGDFNSRSRLAAFIEILL